jgi:Cu/Ag efflux protein CusF
MADAERVLSGPRRSVIGAILVTLVVVSPPSLAAPLLAQALPHADYTGTAVVVALLPPPSDLHAVRPVVILHHEPIPGLMEEAMTMPFLADSTVLFRGLRPGDPVAFGLKDTPGALLVVFLRRLK